MIKPELRMLLAPSRSGTTAFLHTMSQHPLTDTATGAMKRNLKSTGEIDYSIYKTSSSLPFIFYKATFGYGSVTECVYNPFRSDSDIKMTRPLFLLRDPIQTMNSWKEMKWGNISLFTLAYQHVLDLFWYARTITDETRCIAYEHIASYPLQIFHSVFLNWGIPYTEDILRWKTKLGEGTIKLQDLDDRRAKLTLNISRGIHDSLIEGQQTYHLQHSQVILSSSEITQLEKLFREQYREILHLSRQFFPIK